MTAALIVARMSSARFPGKALAPFRGQPLVAHVVRCAQQVFPADQVMVVTSDDATDDPLAAYVMGCLRISVFRGPLHDVFERFRRAAVRVEADWVVRINADSPLMTPAVVSAVSSRAGEPFDLVTTIAPRSLPKGQNPEAIRTATMVATDHSQLTAADREHITAFYHRQPERFRIRNVGCDRADLAAVNLSVDTAEDLARLELMTDDDVARFLPADFHG